MDEKERRDAFNMKVLKRHDPEIIDIVGSAAFVVLYELDEEWTKLGIEGPMFLYRRSTAPFFGFFVLNRNGVENFDAKLTQDDDFDFASDFVIYRAASDEQVLGIWVYDSKEREQVEAQMRKLHKDSSNATSTMLQSPSNPSQQNGQSISLDVLFGSTGTGSSQQQKLASHTNSDSTAGSSLLDSIFQSALPQSSPVRPQQQPQPIDSSNGANDLKAMLGLSSVNNPPIPPSPHQGQPVPSGTLPHSLETIFASARLSPQASHPPPANPQPPKTSNGNALKGEGSADLSSIAGDAINASLSQRPKDEEGVLSQRDFVRQVLSLIHTDKDFVNDLYQRYLSRVQ